jgi:hypothetical protein
LPERANGIHDENCCLHWLRLVYPAGFPATYRDQVTELNETEKAYGNHLIYNRTDPATIPYRENKIVLKIP